MVVTIGCAMLPGSVTFSVLIVFSISLSDFCSSSMLMSALSSIVRTVASS